MWQIAAGEVLYSEPSALESYHATIARHSEVPSMHSWCGCVLAGVIREPVPLLFAIMLALCTVHARSRHGVSLRWGGAEQVRPLLVRELLQRRQKVKQKEIKLRTTWHDLNQKFLKKRKKTSQVCRVPGNYSGAQQQCSHTSHAWLLPSGMCGSVCLMDTDAAQAAEPKRRSSHDSTGVTRLPLALHGGSEAQRP